MGSLSVKKVDSLREPGKYGDGEGLYLNVSRSGTKSWILRVRIKGETARREFGLGSLSYLSLAAARERAREMRREAKEGRNQIRRRDHKALTFAEAARETHAKVASTFRNPKHAALWLSSLETYAFPVMGDRPIEMLGREDVLKVLEPIWQTKTDTARRVKQRIATVFDHAIGRGQYLGAQPVDTALAKALPKANRVVEHMAALRWRDVPVFVAHLVTREATAARCLELLILTALRSGEVRGARWKEFDLERGVWEVPAVRMKMKAAHRVPLAPGALALLQSVKELDSDLVFPSPQRNSKGQVVELSVNAFRPLLARMGVEGITVHGFRSTFRDWASEVARAPREVAEAALAHSLGYEVERAYARSDLFDLRRELMSGWAEHVYASAKSAKSLP